MTITKSQIKRLRSLHQKKYRKQYGTFLVQGDKICKELLITQSKYIRTIVATDLWIEKHVHRDLIQKSCLFNSNLTTIAKISTLQSPVSVLMEVSIPPKIQLKDLDPSQNYFFLDQIRDPGNLGTIIRTCDWFGMPSLLLSSDCVDPYNPKVVQASMASLFRVKLLHTTLADVKKHLSTSSILAAEVRGTDMEKHLFGQSTVVVIGNEGHGISNANKSLLDGSISISSSYSLGAESLNAAVATAIIAQRLRR